MPAHDAGGRASAPILQRLIHSRILLPARIHLKTAVKNVVILIIMLIYLQIFSFRPNKMLLVVEIVGAGEGHFFWGFKYFLIKYSLNKLF